MKPSKQLYKKLLYICSAVIISVVVSLMIYFISSTKLRILDNDLNYMRMLSEDASNFIKDSSDTADYIVTDLYRKTTELNDLMSYFEKKDEEYIRYRLDKYAVSGRMEYSGIDDFIQSAFDAYESVERVTLLGVDQEWTTTYFQDQRVLRRNNRVQILTQIQHEDLAQEGEFSFLKEIRNPNTWETSGYMIITFHADKLEKLQQYYSLPQLIVCNQNATFVYSSEEEDYDNSVLLDTRAEEMEKETDAYIEWKDVGTYRVLAYLDKGKAGRIPPVTLLRIFLIGIAVIVFGETLIHYYLKDLAKRLDYILNGMTKVRTGDLSVRLEGNENGDELDIISANFNEMCSELDDYIQKSYLAEIERQNAEMEALQSQINPHFLYNTLEVIRMKAICNGDKEVAKMLYSMAVMFRSQIKDEDMIPLVRELHYCKKYLELFEYRYQSQFVSQVECPEECMQIPIIKFVLQPILENYFIHGIRMDSKENHLFVGVRKNGEDMLIIVDDNGRGMTDEELEKKNRELKENKANEKKSIGISNVNRRLKAVYGTKYGITLEHSVTGGIRVNVRFRVNGRDIIEESNAGRR